MSVTSLQFILFLAVLVAVYFLVSDRHQWKVLLCGSVLFYLITGGWFSFIFICITAFTIYGAARLIAKKKSDEPDNDSAGKGIMTGCIILNLGILIVLKYGVFILKEVCDLTSLFGFSFDVPERTWLLPLGISFYTLQSIGYVIDVYRGEEEPEENFFKLALFVSFFPQLIQGPFSRFTQIGHQLTAPHKWDYIRVKHGVERMAWGYLMKLVMGDRMAVIVSAIVDGYAQYGHVGFTVLISMIIYSFQIYADFLGGMHIIMGASEVLGIHLPENFRQPFLAKSVSEFWQRWHITLGAWMRTYVFYPLAISKPFAKMGESLRKRYGRTISKCVPPSVAAFVVFFLVGMWHGADMKYVVYGIYQAVLVSTHTLFETPYAKMRKACHINADSMAWKAFQVVRTFFIVMVGRYFSVAHSLGDALGMLKATVSSWNPWVFVDGSLFDLGLNESNWVVMLLCIALIIATDIAHEKGISIREKLDECKPVLRWSVYVITFFVIVIFGMYGDTIQVRDFVYQGF